MLIRSIHKRIRVYLYDMLFFIFTVCVKIISLGRIQAPPMGGPCPLMLCPYVYMSPVLFICIIRTKLKILPYHITILNSYLILYQFHYTKRSEMFLSINSITFHYRFYLNKAIFLFL